MNASPPRRSTYRPATGEKRRIGIANVANVAADEVEARPERGQEERPDDLVRALGEGAPGIDHDRRDEQSVGQRRGVTGRAAADRAGPSAVRRFPRRRPVGEPGSSATPSAGIPVATWVRRPSRTATAMTSDAATADATAASQKTNASSPTIDAPTPPIAGPNRRPAICAAPYSPNASPWRSRRRGVDEEARGPPGRRRRSPARPAARSDDERDRRPRRTSGSGSSAALTSSAADHQRLARGPVGDPAEDRLGDEAGRRPGGDDQPEGREVDPPRREVERQDRQERAEAEPDDELGQRTAAGSGATGRARRMARDAGGSGTMGLVGRVGRSGRRGPDGHRSRRPRPRRLHRAARDESAPRVPAPIEASTPYHRLVPSPALLALALVLFLVLLAPTDRLRRAGWPPRALGAYLVAMLLLGLLVAELPGPARFLVPILVARLPRPVRGRPGRPRPVAEPPASRSSRSSGRPIKQVEGPARDVPPPDGAGPIGGRGRPDVPDRVTLASGPSRRAGATMPRSRRAP